jgi:hypothetical protein
VVAPRRGESPDGACQLRRFALLAAAVAAIEPLRQVIQGKIKEFSAKNHLSAGDLSRRAPQNGANSEEPVHSNLGAFPQRHSLDSEPIWRRT